MVSLCVCLWFRVVTVGTGWLGGGASLCLSVVQGGDGVAGWLCVTLCLCGSGWVRTGWPGGCASLCVSLWFRVGSVRTGLPGSCVSLCQYLLFRVRIVGTCHSVSDSG